MGKQLAGIDGLRAVAVLCVVAYHAGLPVSAGYVGVDVFFVISGYVITRMLLREPQIDLAAFYARRVRRILPALVVVVASVLVLTAALLPADLQIATNRSAIASMSMAANVWFQFHTGYFDPTSDQIPLLHLWSLGVEEQFYLLWPLLLIAFKRKPWVLALLAAGSFWFAEWLSDHAAFYQMPARFWELAVGGLLAFLPASRWGPVSALVGACLLYIAVTISDPNFPGFGAVPVVLGTALVIHAIHSGTWTPLEWTPVRYIGLISYSLYLWHWPLLALAKASTYDVPSLQTNLLLCGLAFLLACLSYHLIEQPFRRGQPKRAIPLGVIACLALAGCSAGMETLLRRSDSLSVRTALDGPRESTCQGLKAKCESDVVLWGDSHAKAWQPLAERYGRVHQLTFAGCIASNRQSQGSQCSDFNKEAVKIAQDAPLVILGGFWLERLPHANGSARHDLESALSALSDVPRVIVIGPVPELPGVPQRCIQTSDFNRCNLSRAEFDKRAAPVLAYMRDTIAKYPNAELLEVADFFCDETTCPMMRDGYSLYWDNDHISVSAAEAFASQLRRH